MTDDFVEIELETTCARLKRRTKTADQYEARLLQLWKSSARLGFTRFITDDETLAEVIQAVVKHASAEATEEQLIQLCQRLGNNQALIQALVQALCNV